VDQKSKIERKKKKEKDKVLLYSRISLAFFFWHGRDPSKVTRWKAKKKRVRHVACAWPLLAALSYS
jgi:hypothetical protein